MIKKMFSYFARCKTCLVPFGIGIAGYVSYMIYIFVKAFSEDPHLIGKEFLIRINMDLAIIPFILFLFIAYEFFSKSRRVNFYECLSATKNGRHSLFFNQLFVLEVLSLAFNALVLVFIFTAYYLQGITDVRFILFTVKVILLYFFCADTVAILIALLLSFIKHSITAYILLICTAILFSPLMEPVLLTIWDISGIYLYKIFDIFVFFWKDISSIVNDTYIFPANNHTIVLLLFWLTVLTGLINVFLFDNKQKIRKIICPTAAFLACVFFVTVNIPYSEISFNYDPKRNRMEDVHYYSFTQPYNLHMQYDEPADFNLTEMELNLKITSKLKATAAVKVDKTDLGDYKFTLSRFYKVKSITDKNGEKLDFERDGDYITVKNNPGNDAFTFSYSGASYGYYNNDQGVCLPAGFTYYPVNGFHYVYNFQQGTTRVTMPQSTPVKMKVDYKNEFFTNLKKTGENEYSGVTDGITIVSGFLKAVEIEGCTVIYQYLAEEITDELRAAIAADKEKYQGKTIISAPVNDNVDESYYFEFQDHITTHSLYEIIMPSDKAIGLYKPLQDLYYRMASFYSEDSEFRKYYDSLIENPNAEYDKDDVNYILSQKIIEYGDEEVMQYLFIHMLENQIIYPGETASLPYDERIIARHIGEKTELELQYEEYDKELYGNA